MNLFYLIILFIIIIAIAVAALWSLVWAIADICGTDPKDNPFRLK